MNSKTSYAKIGNITLVVLSGFGIFGVAVMIGLLTNTLNLTSV